MAHNNDEPIISSLVKSRDKVKKLVTAQIEAAETVLNINVQGQEVVEVLPFGGRGAHWVYDKEQKEAFDAAYRQWDDYNKELFARIFADSNNTDRKKYIQAGEKMCYSGHEDFVAESKKTIRGKVVYMSAFLNRLSLIPSNVDDKKERTNNHVSKEKEPKIFISHKTEDSNYAKLL